MAYRALYREWRPKDFSHVVGQKAIIDTLRNQVVTQRIAHAYLFCGSRGTGKTSTAKILAKAINCLNPVNGDPCGECENCLRADNEETLDVIEIDAASNNGVDEMRELRDTVKYPPQFGTYKVYIIDEVHMLSTSAFNALLKTLEEPPAHVVFILATTEPQKLPETILSRCQRFDFGRLSLPEITGRLKEAADGAGATVSDGALILIARAAEGGMRDALSILDMCLGYSGNIDEALVRSILGSSEASFLFEFCGAMADRADVEAQACERRAAERVKASTEQVFRSTVTGYSTVSLRSSSVQSQDGRATPVLMPVWIITTEKNENGQKKLYTFAINGQTGTLTCDVPYDKGKALKWFLGVFAGAFAAGYGILYLIQHAGVL